MHPYNIDVILKLIISASLFAPSFTLLKKQNVESVTKAINLIYGQFNTYHILSIHFISGEMFEGDFNFFKTIDKVRKLKEKISAMPNEERKDAAEKALAECWKAFFGDDVDL